MHNLFHHFETKLIQSGMAKSGSPLIGFLDAELAWNRNDPARQELAPLFECLSINSILFARPAEPYDSIITYLAEKSSGTIKPEDCETRTFLHDLPVRGRFEIGQLAAALERRKGVIIPRFGIVTCGTVTVEQAFVTFSSICFAAFVKFFKDFLSDKRNNRVEAEQQRVFERTIGKTGVDTSPWTPLQKGPFPSEEKVLESMQEAGRLVVEKRLVDSYFGNISCRRGPLLYISQTGSSLDNLKDCIDPCPLDGSSCAPLTASSELSAHLEIVKTTDICTILHGHPRFAVILSMDCRVDDCKGRDRCHLTCPHDRSVCGVPIVPGEVGTGRYGLCHTIPDAIKTSHAAIVYGHGLFTAGKKDFNDPFQRMLQVEADCREEFLRRTGYR